METFVIKVLDREYSVRADSDSGHVLRIARIVDKKMRQIDRKFSHGSTARTAVLACMNLVDEYLKESKENTDWATRRIGTLIEKLDSVL
ncbi:hypothetical protein CH330_00195 [candidate division WOR-3 bacterium JGI_Cruoil_03_51_56]|uniref:Cell division protein ZapA n=1 Tax=candidate division WOR-3 bacterium JGI_Cruoil_03_51_56 TaxID=1973747 RepID=A0A235BYY4_UNCW3|nr:MAG: hypothetical protein CH330_00195 [candidate division WOR-3 bacterium JGI_Cruoil_03_51_56]